MDTMDSLSVPEHGTLRLGSDDSWDEDENTMPTNPSSFNESEVFLLKLFQEEKTLVKVIQNHDWKQFIDRLAVNEQDLGLKTSTTMLPRDGRMMRLYGKPYQYSVGLVWNLNDIESSVCWCWPAGFYAKTEFNVDPVTNKLSKGLQEALVTLEQLHINNAQLLANANTCNNNSFSSPSSSTATTPATSEVSFNEVFATVTVRSLVGVICRSREYQHLLLAMGVRDTLSRLFDLSPLPIVFHDPQTGIRILTHHHQQQILTDCIQRVCPFASFPVAVQNTVPKPSQVVTPMTSSSKLLSLTLSLSSQTITSSSTSSASTTCTIKSSTTASSSLSPTDLHSPSPPTSPPLTPTSPTSPTSPTQPPTSFTPPLARFLPLGCDDHHVVDLRRYTHIKSSRRVRDKDRLNRIVKGVCSYHDSTSIHHNNDDDHHLVEEKEKEVEPDVVEEEEEEQVFSAEDQMRFMGSHGGLRECIAEIIGQAMQRGDYMNAERLVLTGLLGAASTSNSHSLETIIRVVSAIVVEHPKLYVPARVDRICMQVRNHECMLVGLGAYKAIGGVATGDVLGRLHQATAQIEEWLRRSRDSYLYCLESFTAVSGMEEASVVPFLSGKAIQNRQAFLHNLRQLEALSRATRATRNNSSGNNNNENSINNGNISSSSSNYSGEMGSNHTSDTNGCTVSTVVDDSDVRCLSQALYEPYLRHIITLISSMHSPCLRLQLLQFVLGLDDRFSKRVLEKSTCLALDIVKDIITQQQSHPSSLDQHRK